ncbi:MAG TPA: shikimate dehydrogenase [Trueperaceae bacterium]|nr:shikimate dehydrogenase [Trueperaceae bacterium]
MTRRAYLLAHPAGHSLSPRMHGAAFEVLGLEATYEALDVPPARLAEVVAGLRLDPDFLGANVTTPHKLAVLVLLDELTEAARAVGAVNTVVPRGGRLVGDNTDVAGFAASLEGAGFRAGGGHAVLLGAGGAANAVAYALARLGVPTVVASRRAEAAAELVAALRPVARGLEAVAAADLPRALAGAALLVNATTVGMAGGPAPGELPLGVDVGLLPPGALVNDLVYNPRVTPLLAAAKARGLATLDGLPMLVEQGAASLRLWTGLEPPLEAMRAAVGA